MNKSMPKKKKLVMIGNGMAGMKAIETILEIAPDRFEITIFGAEKHPNYNRILLSAVLAGDMSIEDIILHNQEWYRENGLTLHLGKRVTEILLNDKTVTARDGTKADYDLLIIATGSRPFILPIPGVNRKGVISFREIEDCRRMMEASKKHKRAAVIGGGLLGLEAAKGLLNLGMEVTVVHDQAALMNMQLDETAGRMLRESLEKQGIKFRLCTLTAEVTGEKRVSGLKFADGSNMACDLVVMAVGIRPNKQLAEDSLIFCNRGIVVNDYLQSTSDPCIYAVGECVEHRGKTYGLVAPLFEQARVLAGHITGQEPKPYSGSDLFAKLKVSGVNVFSAGKFLTDERDDVIEYLDETGGVYKKLVLRDDRIIGAVLFGDTELGPGIFRMIQDKTEVSGQRDSLLFSVPDEKEMTAEAGSKPETTGSPGEGIMTPEDLVRIGEAAGKYQVPTLKITGGQRIDFLGVSGENLDKIRKELDTPSGTYQVKQENSRVWLQLSDIKSVIDTYRTVCFYCGTGCGIKLEVCDNRIVNLSGDPDHPTNQGMLCSKGKNLHKTVNHPDRLLYPMTRDDLAGKLKRTSWKQALEYGASAFARIIRENGPEAVGFYVSGQLPTEDYYLFNKLMKGFIGSNNLDSNSRLCMSSAVVGYKRAFGVDAPPTCYEDIELADNVFIIGANPAYTHPIIFRRIEQAKQENPDMRVVVIDPRKTASCSLADLHLQINPGTDVILLQAILNLLVWEGLVNRSFIESHTTGFDKVMESAKQVTPKIAARICGVEPQVIAQAAYLFAQGKTLSLWTMGLNQSTSGTHKNNALLNLHLAAGQIGRPGCGPFSLTGQPNAMGGREVGGLSNLLPAHRDLASEADRKEVARIWGAKKIQAKPGLAATEMFEALAAGKLKAIWIICTNPLVSLPDTSLVERALRKAELVMVSDVFPTDTGQFAHILLPAAGWAEKEGTATNCERRICYLPQALTPPGECLPDWQIGRDFALKLGKHLGRDWSGAFNYPDTESIFQEHQLTTRGRDCDITGLSYSLLRRQGSQQWPYPENASRGRKRLYEDNRFETPDGKARFIDVNFLYPAEPVDETYPLSLTTGRLRDQWHTMTKTGRVPELMQHDPFPALSIHPDDAGKRKLGDGDLARVISRRGEITVSVCITDDVKRGVLFLPMHWGKMSAAGGGANRLVGAMVDPVSKEPEFKHTAVEVKKWTPKWRGTILLSGQKERRGREIIKKFDYGVVSSLGRENTVTWVEIASDREFEEKELDALEKEPFKKMECITCRDCRTGVFKKAWIENNRLQAVRLISKEIIHTDWLRELIQNGGDVENLRPYLFVSSGGEEKGKIVCSCMSVGEKEIKRTIEEGAASVDEIKECLSAGTGCGSCVPELHKMLGKI